MDKSRYEIRREAVKEAIAAAEATVAEARMLRAMARETRERVALDTRIRREFIDLPEEARREGLRRRTYYSPLDAAGNVVSAAPFLL